MIRTMRLLVFLLPFVCLLASRMPLLAQGYCRPGEYYGLLSSIEGGVHEHSGYFKMRIGTSDRVSGSMVLGGRGYSFSGFSGFAIVYGKMKIDLPHGGYDGSTGLYDPDPIEIKVPVFQLYFSTAESEKVSGYLVCTQNWGSDILGNRVVFDARVLPAPQAGRYTVIFAGGDGYNGPAGAGYGLVTVDRPGHVVMSGFLGDGTPISQRTFIAEDGSWPLFVNLYRHLGSVLGWVHLGPTAADENGGTAVWTRPTVGSTAPDAIAFENAVQVMGSPFVCPGRNQPVLSLTNGVVVFSGGGLAQAFTNRFVMTPGGKVSGFGTNRLSLAFVPSTGMFRGSVKDPGSGRMLAFKGAVLQDQGCGYGFFLGRNRQSGWVYVGVDGNF